MLEISTSRVDGWQIQALEALTEMLTDVITRDGARKWVKIFVILTGMNKEGR